MKAIVYTEYGGPDVLRYTEVPQPAIGDTDVLVQVRAASLNFGDRAALRGRPGLIRLAMGLRRPKATILGRDIAGTVAAVGPKATLFRVGDDVFGEVSQNGFAEYVAASQVHLAAKPASVSFEQAATLPVAATTALQALRLADVAPGKSVLVNGASGGVGTFAVQLAKTLDAKVTAVCRTRNIELIRSLGADDVVNYTRDDVTGGAARFDAILDFSGDHRLADMRRILAPRGVYIASTGNGGALLGPIPLLLTVVTTAPLRKQRLRVLTAKRNIEDLAHLAGLVAAGTVKPVIERQYPLAETAEAIRFIEQEHARGKVVLVP
jgi:NADPH:quinone reductase-like Zn-dependent oxidoreductase